MKKNEIRGLAVLIIILAVFSIICFVLPLPKTTVFWIAWIFAVAAVAVQGYALYAGFVRGDQARSKLYGFPVARIGTVYMVFQLVASLVLILLGAWVPVWVAVILCMVALAAAAIGMISAEAVREEIETQDRKLQKDVSTIRALQSKARSVAGLCGDPAAAAALQSFSEALRYSDPVSSDALADIEGELAALVEEMQKAALEGDWTGAVSLSRKAALVLNERNRLCRLNK